MPRRLRDGVGIGALVVDDQPDVRRLMCFLLEDDDGLFVSGEAGQAIPPPQPYSPGGSSTSTGRVSYSSGAATGAGAIAAAAASDIEGAEHLADGNGAEAPAPVQQRRVEESEQIGRNDPCWCGSGKKYKKCHGA